jgi:hypothetical protein
MYKYLFLMWFCKDSLLRKKTEIHPDSLDTPGTCKNSGYLGQAVATREKQSGK